MVTRGDATGRPAEGRSVSCRDPLRFSQETDAAGGARERASLTQRIFSHAKVVLSVSDGSKRGILNVDVSHAFSRHMLLLTFETCPCRVVIDIVVVF